MKHLVAYEQRDVITVKLQSKRILNCERLTFHFVTADKCVLLFISPT